MFAVRAFIGAAVLGPALAVPADFLSVASLFTRQAFTPIPLNATAQSAYTPHAHLASAAYCLQSDVKVWNCGGDCSAVPNLVNVTVGGNNQASVPYFVGYYNYTTMDLTMTGTNDGKGTIVVSHQGTAGGLALNGLLNLTPIPLSPLIFGSGLGALRATTGFTKFHAQTQAAILADVQAKMAFYKTNKILVTGHSLGSALSVLSAIQFKNRLHKGTIVSSISFAGPRLGNKALADWAGQNLNKIRHVNNKADFVPVIPGRTALDLNKLDIPATLALNALEITAAYALGTVFAGQQGEIHIDAEDGLWYDCGPTVEDNDDKRCSTGLVTTVSAVSITNDFAQPRPGVLGGDHGGPYNGVRMSAACTRQNPNFITPLL